MLHNSLKRLPPLYHDKTSGVIEAKKAELVTKQEASELFGQDHGKHLQGILGNIDQTFGGEELYPSVEEKADHLLYFYHQRSPLFRWQQADWLLSFILFLQENDLLDASGMNDNGLVALALLIAESDPRQKELMVRLVLNLLKH